MAKTFLNVVMVLCLIPLVLLLRAIRPLVLIRCGQMGGTGRIGNLAPDIEFYLAEDFTKVTKVPKIDLFFYPNPASNEQLRIMANRKLHVIPFVKWIDFANRKIPGGKMNQVDVNSGTRYVPPNLHDLLTNTPVQLSFLMDEEQKGKEGLSKLGISSNREFVCFHNRDQAYLSKYFPEGDYEYHNYRDCSIKNYIPAADELSRRSYILVRMGIEVEESVDTGNPMIVDYASTSRSDFMDIYLASNCKFFLSSGGGIEVVACIFRRPIACANFIPIGNPYMRGPRDIFIPKKLWLSSENRYLTFREIIQSGIGNYSNTEEYESSGIKVCENTAQEICDLAIEMDERLNGTWNTSDGDEELQRRFWQLYEGFSPSYPFNTRIGSEFLRNNKVLLD